MVNLDQFSRTTIRRSLTQKLFCVSIPARPPSTSLYNQIHIDSSRHQQRRQNFDFPIIWQIVDEAPNFTGSPLSIHITQPHNITMRFVIHPSIPKTDTCPLTLAPKQANVFYRRSKPPRYHVRALVQSLFQLVAIVVPQERKFTHKFWYQPSLTVSLCCPLSESPRPLTKFCFDRAQHFPLLYSGCQQW